jgi:hypothetical protein
MGIFLDVFGRQPAEVAGGEVIHRIADELDRLDPDFARYLACFAFILSRVANADRQVSGDEVARRPRRLPVFSTRFWAESRARRSRRHTATSIFAAFSRT